MIEVAEISLERTLNALILKMANNGEWEDEPGGKLIPAMKIGKNISQVKCKGLNYQGERNKSGPTLCYTRECGGGEWGWILWHNGMNVGTTTAGL
jgi:hypothetical protein